ncbi:4794_t:CDS:2 [Acaulospora morrowiae]|uniref:4794_t:CDS:1 n=1 Tax=Acaulospora morrowiae TaxID=94023 RepID=A0A9N9FYJ6_9GLOM|nr:4794_t:CDS:2 [Acaulospora morrowiae]
MEFGIWKEFNQSLVAFHYFFLPYFMGLEKLCVTHTHVIAYVVRLEAGLLVPIKTLLYNEIYLCYLVKKEKPAGGNSAFSSFPCFHIHIKSYLERPCIFFEGNITLKKAVNVGKTCRNEGGLQRIPHSEYIQERSLYCYGEIELFMYQTLQGYLAPYTGKFLAHSTESD